MLKKERAAFAQAYEELKAEGFYAEMAKTLHLEHYPKASLRSRAAKKLAGNKKVTAEKPKRRAVADRCAKLSAGR